MDEIEIVNEIYLDLLRVLTSVNTLWESAQRKKKLLKEQEVLDKISSLVN